jgi:hypothetical protein
MRRAKSSLASKNSAIQVGGLLSLFQESSTTRLGSPRESVLAAIFRSPVVRKPFQARHRNIIRASRQSRHDDKARKSSRLVLAPQLTTEMLNIPSRTCLDTSACALAPQLATKRPKKPDIVSRPIRDNTATIGLLAQFQSEPAVRKRKHTPFQSVLVPAPSDLDPPFCTLPPFPRETVHRRSDKLNSDDKRSRKSNALNGEKKTKRPAVHVSAIKISPSATKNTSLAPKRCKSRSKAPDSVEAIGVATYSSNNDDYDDANCVLPIETEIKRFTSIAFATQIVSMSNPNHQCQGIYSTQFPSLLPELNGSRVFDVEEICESIPFRPWPIAHSSLLKQNSKKEAQAKNTKQRSKLVKKKVRLSSKSKLLSTSQTVLKPMDTKKSVQSQEASARRSRRHPVQTDRYSPEATTFTCIKETKTRLSDGKRKTEAVCLLKQEIPVILKRSRRSVGYKDCKTTKGLVEEDIPSVIPLLPRQSLHRVVQKEELPIVVKQTCRSDGKSNSSTTKKRLAKEAIPVVAKRTRLSLEKADTHNALAIWKEDEKKKRRAVRKVDTPTNMTEGEKVPLSKPARQSIEKSTIVSKNPGACKQVTKATIKVLEPAEPNKKSKREKSSVISAGIIVGSMGTVPMDLCSWTYEQLNLLREAHISADPTSSLFWSSVAAKVEGKSDAECRTKWFSLVKTPAPKRVRPVQNLPTVGKQDDLFHATPMRGVPSSPAANVVVNFDVGSPIVDSRTANRQLLTEYGDETSTVRVTQKVGYKTYLQGLRRGVAKGERERKVSVPKRQYEPKRPHNISERVESGAIEMNCQLTPGGTLKVKTFAEDDFFDDMDSDDSGNEL